MRKISITIFFVAAFSSTSAHAQVNGQTVSSLPIAGVLTGNELVPIVQNGVTVRTTLSQLQAYAGICPPVTSNPILLENGLTIDLENGSAMIEE